jgi:hypothetical protein
MAAETKEERMMKDVRWKESSMNVVYRRYKSHSDEILGEGRARVGGRPENGRLEIYKERSKPKTPCTCLHQA